MLSGSGGNRTRKCAVQRRQFPISLPTRELYQTAIERLTKSTITDRTMRAETAVMIDMPDSSHIGRHGDRECQCDSDDDAHRTILFHLLSPSSGTSGDRTHDRQIKSLLIYR